MRFRGRLAAVALALLLPGLFLLRWWLAVLPQPDSSDVALPAAMGPWSVVQEEELDAVALAELQPSAYVARRYAAPGKTRIGLYVGFYSGRAGITKRPHLPEVCYPSQGWEAIGSQAIEVPVSKADSLPATLLDMRRGTATELVLYWFQPAGRWPGSVAVEQLMFVFDAVAGRPQYAFVRLVAAVPSGSVRSRAARDLIDLATEVAWPVRTALSPKDGTTSAALRSSSR